MVFGLAFVSTPALLANHCNLATEQELSIGIQGPRDPSNPTATPPTIHCVPKNASSFNTNPIVAFLITVVQFFMYGIGIALTAGLVIGGVVHETARGNAQQVQKAEEIIRNVIIGIALYVFMFAIINFIIPGRILLSV